MSMNGVGIWTDDGSGMIMRVYGQCLGHVIKQLNSQSNKINGAKGENTFQNGDKKKAFFP